MAWYDKWAIMVITAAVGLAGYEGIPWCKMDVTIWAYWVGAIGSISAIAGSFAVARFQAREASKVRRIEVLEEKNTVSQMARRLAIDTVLCLDNTRGNIESRMTTPRSIGHERLEQLQASLHSFANKNIPAEILSELLVLQREVAFTQMAIREIGSTRPEQARVDNADRRTARVIRCRDTLRDIARAHKAEWLTAKV